MFDAIHIVPKLNAATHERVECVANQIREAAISSGVRVLSSTANCGSSVDVPLTDRTLVIAVGGDGTMLEAMRRAARSHAVALGVNLGRVGFLTDIDASTNIKYLMWSILNGSYKLTVQDRMLLATDIAPEAIACNEIAVSSATPDAMITYRLVIDGYNAGVHRANCIMASTSTGSTAYAMSAGGALMMPDLQAIQIVPVAATTMTSRPIVVSPTSVITLEILEDSASVRADGQRIATTPKQPISKITIRRHTLSARVAHVEGWNYFDMLTKKLGWVCE